MYIQFYNRKNIITLRMEDASHNGIVIHLYKHLRRNGSQPSANNMITFCLDNTHDIILGSIGQI